MPLIITDGDGKKWRFGGGYRTPLKGDYYLGANGELVVEVGETGPGVRAIVIPVPVIHEFGGVRFEEEPSRVPQDREWCLMEDRPFVSNGNLMGEYPILRYIGGK